MGRRGHGSVSVRGWRVEEWLHRNTQDAAHCSVTNNAYATQGHRPRARGCQARALRLPHVRITQLHAEGGGADPQHRSHALMCYSLRSVGPVTNVEGQTSVLRHVALVVALDVYCPQPAGKRRGRCGSRARAASTRGAAGVRSCATWISFPTPSDPLPCKRIAKDGRAASVLAPRHVHARSANRKFQLCIREVSVHPGSAACSARLARECACTRSRIAATLAASSNVSG
jgi:hypothetical protein